MLEAQAFVPVSETKFAVTTDYNSATGDPRWPMYELARAGIPGVMICERWSDDQVFSDNDVDNIHAVLRETGQFVDTIHASPGKLQYMLDTNPDAHQAAVDSIINRLRMAEKIGAHSIVLHIPGQEDPKFNAGQLRSVLDQTLRVAEDAGVNIAAENLDVITGRYWDNLPTITDWIKVTNHPRFRMALDVGHAHASGDNFKPGGRIWEVKDLIVATHLHDNLGAIYDHEKDEDTHLLPFDGTIDWEDVTTLLASSESYSGTPLTFEVSRKTYRERGMSTEEFLKLARTRGELLAQQRDAKLRTV